MMEIYKILRSNWSFRVKNLFCTNIRSPLFDDLDDTHCKNRFVIDSISRSLGTVRNKAYLD